MKTHALIAMVQIVICAPMASAQLSIAEQPSASVRSCIVANASAVERAIESLDEATEFLVHRVCLDALTDQVIDRNKREAEAYKAQTDAMCKELMAEPKPAPKPDDDPSVFGDEYYLRSICEQRSGPTLPEYTTFNGDSLYFGESGRIGAPRVEALAAQTLLKLRVERLNRKP